MVTPFGEPRSVGPSNETRGRDLAVLHVESGAQNHDLSGEITLEKRLVAGFMAGMEIREGIHWKRLVTAIEVYEVSVPGLLTNRHRPDPNRSIG